MAVKQCLVGICFVGVRELIEVDKDGRVGIPKQIYYNWMGAALQIQQMNEVLNEQCREFEKLLQKDGYKSCVFKGQGFAELYKVARQKCRYTDSRDAEIKKENSNDGIDLSKLRQLGDIDTWVLGESCQVIE